MARASDNEFPSVLFDEQASDPATPASGFWRAYMKSDGMYVIDDAGATTGPFGGGGGGGFTQELVGTTTVGGTAETVGANFKVYAKVFTTAQDRQVGGLRIRIGSTGIIGSMAAAIYTDNAGTPQYVVSEGPTVPLGLNMNTSGPRNVWLPLGPIWLPAGTYHMAWRGADTGGAVLPIVYYDAAGTDQNMTLAAANWTEWASGSTTTRNYSMCLQTIR